LFAKRNNVDELINMPTKAKEKSMIQISFRTQDPIIKEGSTKPANPLDLRQKISALSKAKSVYSKTYFLSLHASLMSPLRTVA